MTDNYELQLKIPSGCRAQELEVFQERTELGGEVDDGGLAYRIVHAEKLAFLSVDGNLVGTAGLKNPEQTYRLKVSRKSDFELPVQQFPYELGWIYVVPEAEGRGYAKAMAGVLLHSIKGHGVFATTRTNNGAMNHLLPSTFKFVASGNLYKARDKVHDLRLYTRAANGERH